MIRWKSLSILTKGEKKQIYSEFTTQNQKKIQETDRKHRIQVIYFIIDNVKAKNLFINELKSIKDLQPNEIFALEYH